LIFTPSSVATMKKGAAAGGHRPEGDHVMSSTCEISPHEDFSSGRLTDCAAYGKARSGLTRSKKLVAPSSQFLRRPAFRVGFLRPRRWQEHARHVPAVRTLIRDQAGFSGTRRDSHHVLHHGPASRAYWTSVVSAGSSFSRPECVTIGAGTSAFRLNARHPIRSAIS
jgi:hypothetical protein